MIYFSNKVAVIKKEWTFFIISFLLKISRLCMYALGEVDERWSLKYKDYILSVSNKGYFVLRCSVKRCWLSVYTCNLILIRFKIIWFKNLVLSFMKHKTDTKGLNVFLSTRNDSKLVLTFSYMQNPVSCSENNS